ncbi:MAG: membrane-bound lytic murein transglycosylase C [Candidatus Azotimanducaceae bacterium]
MIPAAFDNNYPTNISFLTRGARICLLSCLLLLGLAGCSTISVRDITSIANDPSSAADIVRAKGIYYAANPEKLNADLKALKARIKEFRKQIDSVWGKEEHKQPSPKVYVKYTDRYYNRAFIDFESGEVIVETVAPDSQQRYLKKAIVTTLLTPEDPRQVDLYSDADPGKDGKPFLYKQILDHKLNPITVQLEAEQYAQYLIENSLRQVRIGKRSGLRVVFPLVNAHNQIRAYKYAELVQRYSRKYNVTKSLIYGVIKTESSFNPFAVSPASAYGLMQIVPSTAGRDVFERIKNKRGQPSPKDLYDPEYNIDIGTAYLKLLQEQYLVRIRDQNAQRYSVISAYNGGASNVFKTFSSNQTRALAKINLLAPEEVYRQLNQNHPIAESRRYLYKVTEAQKEFWRNEGFVEE